MHGEDSYRDLFTRRVRKIKPPAASEIQIQIALIQRLKLLGRPDCTYFHVPNGGERNKRTAALFKAMGVSPGVSDLLFFWPLRQALFLELKADDKRAQTDEQIFFQQRMRICGFNAECAHGLDEAVAILERYGLLDRQLREQQFAEGP